MPVNVEFPDGTIREMPSRKREIKSRGIGNRRPPILVDEPLPNSEWRFETALGGKWWATARN